MEFEDRPQSFSTENTGTSGATLSPGVEFEISCAVRRADQRFLLESTRHNRQPFGTAPNFGCDLIGGFLQFES